MNTYQDDKDKLWLKDFKDFVSSAPVNPPKEISDRIFKTVHEDLHPPFWKVFSKLALIHLVVGSIVLLFCPQFGISLFGGMGLMSLFMRFGEQACMAACGAVFTGASALTASLILRPQEIGIIRKTRSLQISGLAMLSMGVFICAGADVIASLALFWTAGAVLGGIGFFELGWILRSRMRSRAAV
ncbi:MAG: hypothetical protein AB7F43_12275 [Bacteriovoracia bacterium]